jgi:hypothetical protein
MKAPAPADISGSTMMTQTQTGGLTVDLLLAGYRLFGVTYHVTERNRLGDILNGSGENVSLKHASIMSLKGQVMASLPEIVIQKKQLIAAIPKESEEHQQQARQYRAGMLKPSLVRVPVLAVLPPFAATGRVHISPSSDLSHPEHSGLAKFFPLTDAVVYAGEERLYNGPIVLVNRDMLAMMGKTGEAIAEKPRHNGGQDNALADVIAALNQQVSR